MTTVFTACAIAESVVYGPYVAIFALAAYHLVSHGDRLYGGRVQKVSAFVLLLIAFALSTFLWGSQIIIALRTESALADTLSRIGVVVFYISSMTADAIVAMNILRLAQWAFWVKILLLALWLAAAISGAVSLVGCLGWFFACGPPALTSWFLSVAFNAIITVLLARVAWLLLRGSSLPAKRREKVIAYALVTCSSAYFLFGLAKVRIILGTDDPVPRGIIVVDSVLHQLTGMYPAFLTLLVAIVLKDPSATLPTVRPVTASPPDVLVGGVHSYPIPWTGGATAVDPTESGRVAALEPAKVAALMEPKHESVIGQHAFRDATEGRAVEDVQWDALRRAALDAGIPPQAILASINLVQSERLEEVPPTYHG